MYNMKAAADREDYSGGGRDYRKAGVEGNWRERKPATEAKCSELPVFRYFSARNNC